MTRNEKRALERKAERMAKHLRAVTQEAQRYEDDYQAATPAVRTFLRGFLAVETFTAYKDAADTLSAELALAIATYMDEDE